MKIDLADFILQPIGFEHKFKDDDARKSFLSGGYQTATLFCPTCGKERIFTAIRYTDGLNYALVHSQNGDSVQADHVIHRVKFACGCGKSWIEIILEPMSNSRLVKIGQYPDAVYFDEGVNSEAIAMASEEENTYYINAAKACYNGLYIAAFSYLRRVLESLVIKAENQANITTPKVKMKERIAELVEKGALNGLLIEPGFNTLYNVLSKGVHELSEDECREQYPILRDAIDTIFEDELRTQQLQQRKLKISKDLNAINSGNKPKS